MSILRHWATPLTVGGFLIMAVTGSLMFFHLDSGLNKVVHEWAGWLMVAGVVAHLILNWRAFKGYFKRPLPVAIMAVSVLALGLSFVSPGGAGGGNPMIKVVGALQSAKLETVVALSGVPLQDSLARLAEAGFEATGETRFGALTGGSREVEGQLIELLFSR